MTGEIRQIGWTFFFQSGFSFSKGLERKVAKEMAGLKAFILPSVFLCLDFAQECGRKGRRALTRSVCCACGPDAQAWGVGWADRALSCLPDHVCCHHPPSQFVVRFVFDVLSPLCFWEWVIVMLIVMSGPPHDQFLIIEARQIVWVCLLVNARFYFNDLCLSLHFC